MVTTSAGQERTSVHRPKNRLIAAIYLLDRPESFGQTPDVGRKAQFHCDVRASFATALRNWRRKHKIPLKAIATDLGLSISTIASWESGEYFPTGYNFELLVEYTGLPPCKLFCVMADKCVPADCLLAMRKIRARRV